MPFRQSGSLQDDEISAAFCTDDLIAHLRRDFLPRNGRDVGSFLRNDIRSGFFNWAIGNIR